MTSKADLWELLVLKNNSCTINQLTSRHDPGILMSPMSPRCAAVCVLAPPQNVHCGRKSERHSHTNPEKLSNKVQLLEVKTATLNISVIRFQSSQRLGKENYRLTNRTGFTDEEMKQVWKGRKVRQLKELKTQTVWLGSILYFSISRWQLNLVTDVEGSARWHWFCRHTGVMESNWKLALCIRAGVPPPPQKRVQGRPLVRMQPQHTGDARIVGWLPRTAAAVEEGCAQRQAESRR